MIELQRHENREFHFAFQYPASWRLNPDAGGDLRARVGLPSQDVPAFLAGPDEVVLSYPEQLSPAVVLRGGDGSVRAMQQSRVLLRV